MDLHLKKDFEVLAW